MLGNVGDAVSLVLDPGLLAVVFAAAVVGMFVGAIPGLTATLATALLVPIVFFLDPLPAVGAIVALSAMAIFAGDIPGAMVRIPGTPASAAYVEDAYRLTRQGKGALVMSVGLLASSLGGIAGTLVLMVAAPLLAKIALLFTTFEYFWVAVLGLTAAVIISRGSQVKGAISLLLGLFISTVGLDIYLGYARFTFGSTELLGGISFIPAMIGLFGLAEILRTATTPETKLHTVRLETRGMFREAARTLWRYRRGVATGNVIGGGIGALPGAGGDIAAWVSYAATKNVSDEGDQFGKGHIEPVASASAANNSGIASAYVPTLVFGIPGDTITAILLGVLLVKGLTPGPSLFEQQPAILYGIFLIFLLANLLMIPLGYLAIRSSGYLLRVPARVLGPIILAFCIVGSFAINNSNLEIIVMLVLGVIGFAMERNGFPVAPAVLGIVLGPIVEKNFMASVIKTDWDFTEFFTRPVSAILMTLTILVLAYPLLRRAGQAVRRARRKDADDTVRERT